MSPKQIKQSQKKLPKKFQWKAITGKLQYAQSFLKALSRLAFQEVEFVTSRLLRFCIAGPDDPALQTHKTEKGFSFPKTPIGAMISRINRCWRFSWYQDGLSIIICNLFRKGDSRLPY